MKEDEPGVGKGPDVANDAPRPNRMGPVATWVVLPEGGMKKTGDVFAVPGRRLKLVETPPPVREEYTIDTADGDMQHYLRGYGQPSEIHDLSVDRFTGRKLSDSDFAASVKLVWSAESMSWHPKLLEQAMEKLAGRRPLLKTTDDTVEIIFDCDESAQSAANSISREEYDIYLFGFSFAYLAGALPQVSVYRYRNLNDD
jgi:FtsP/CotA-like multicopper oxidase with cupredoxin domain